ncbi:MAG: alpha/beta hydrolase [Burkholderiaceae bacterium]|nr:alpha/beta hydrolase [Burkholderiaceae bacterium]
MKRIVLRIAVSVLVWACAVAGLIAFGTAKAPPVLDIVTKPFATIDDTALPPLRAYRPRDGLQLTFREYPAGGRQVAILIHGSAGSSEDMHPLAQALQGAGATVYVPDLRGHGANMPHGDIAYDGQLDDDLADLVDQMRPQHPGATWTLLGFSSGGGFALRVCADVPLGQAFDRYILVSPYLKYNAPSVRNTEAHTEGPGGQRPSVTSASWAAPYIGRIIGLSTLNFLGVHAWDGLPVIAFAVPPNVPSVTRTYSWRLLRNFGARPDYLADIRAIHRPTHVYVGAADELLVPDKLKAEFQSQRPDIAVSIIPGMGHSDMITRPEAIRFIAAEFL